MSTDQDLKKGIDQKLEEQKSLINGQGKSSSLNQNSLEKSSLPVKRISNTLTPLLEIFQELRREILERGITPKYKTGLKELDNSIWGVHKKQLLVVGARTSMGKSCFALHLARQIANEAERRVIYFTLEMSKDQILERLFTNHCRIDNLNLQRGLAKGEFLAKERMFEHYIKDLKLLIDDTNGYDFDRMCDVCDVIKPDFVIIDYIQMVSAKGRKSKLEAIEEYVRGIKQKACEMNFGAILLSQLNRAGAGVEADLVHLKHSGTLEEHPDTVLLVSWEPIPRDAEKGIEGDPNRYFITVKKQRHGIVGGKIEVKFLPQFSRFEDGRFMPGGYK